MAEPVNEPVESNEEEELTDSDGENLVDSDEGHLVNQLVERIDGDEISVLDGDFSQSSEEESEPETPPHLRMLAAVVQRGDVDELRAALERNNLNVDINTPVLEGFRALDLAAEKGHLSCVELLLSRGADMEAAHEEGVIPLHYAYTEGFTEIAQLLLRSAKNSECVKRMVEAVNMEGNTPLHLAAEYDQVDSIRLLLEWGASPTITNDDGKTPIEKAKPDSEARRILVTAAQAETIGKVLKLH